MPQEVVGLEHAGGAHVGTVIVDLLSGAKGDDAEEYDLGETGVTGEENPG